MMGPSTVRNAAERAMGYKQIITKHGLFDATLLIQTKGMKFEDGKVAAQQLLAQQVKFDAIFAFTDTLAIGAMNHLLEQQIRIPEDVSIASFSGTELATIVYPQLTSVEQPLSEMGEKAAELILQKINDPVAVNETVVMNAELIYRASTIGR
jgi:LacI family transcriptional regulator